MLTALLILILLGLATLLLVAYRKPDDYRYSRSATMNVHPSRIFPLINNLRNWDQWSPWAKLDPNAKTTFDGSGEGIGAKMSWDGNSKVGAGTMMIVNSDTDKRIVLDLEFFKPFKGKQSAEFLFEVVGTQTRITWSAYGKNSLMGKVMSTLIDCEKMMGKNFDQGLANLRAVVER